MLRHNSLFAPYLFKQCKKCEQWKQWKQCKQCKKLYGAVLSPILMVYLETYFCLFLLLLFTVRHIQLECNMFLIMITYFLMQVTEVMISIQWFDRYNICGIARL